jgi:ribose 5-phosphate isomerase B
MKIYLGSDHNGFSFKKRITDHLISLGHQVIDTGDLKLDPDDDFPKFAAHAVDQLLSDNDPDSRSILICGSGQGMVMAANRFKHIRASLCWNVKEAHDARNDDDSNVLCLSANQLTIGQTEQIISVWLKTPFAAAPRFIRRLKELDSLG